MNFFHRLQSPGPEISLWPKYCVPTHPYGASSVTLIPLPLSPPRPKFSSQSPVPLPPPLPPRCCCFRICLDFALTAENHVDSCAALSLVDCRGKQLGRVRLLHRAHRTRWLRCVLSATSNTPSVKGRQSPRRGSSESQQEKHCKTNCFFLFQFETIIVKCNGNSKAVCTGSGKPL